MQTEMVDAGWPLWICGLQLHEGVLADLNINKRYLPLFVRVPECLRKSHCLRVVSHGLIQIRNTERHMIETNDSTIRTLGDSLDGQSNNDSRNEQKKTAHKQLLSSRLIHPHRTYCPFD